MPRILVHEGGKVDDPHDPGGRTNQGVTQKVYNGYRTKGGLDTRDVYDMEPSERDAIYRLQYWDAIKGDELPDGIDYVVFDGAVNSGPSQSIKWLQRALGSVTVDGQMGQSTLAALQEHGDPAALVDLICDRRLSFLQALKTWPRYGNGWGRRVASVRNTGKAWALGGDPKPQPPPLATKKAPISDAKTLPGKGAADATTGGGIVSGGVGTGLETARQQLEPLTGVNPFIGKVVAFLIIAGVVLTIAGIAYRWYASRKAKSLADALDLPQGVAA